MTYNGWTNFETWGVALVLDNDEGTYSMCHERAREMWDESEADSILTREERARYDLAEWLKDFTEDLCGFDSDLGIPEPSMMAQQLLQGAISDVDFNEIARHYINAVQEDA